MAAVVVDNAKVCVTGAGGFLGSWVVKLLLSKDFIVHGTVRDPSDDKNAHLRKLDKASENLKLFKADLLDYESIRTAIQGCDGVFHVASPVPSTSVPNPEIELMEPAVKGTLNVLQASLEAEVKRVVFVSSIIAVIVNPRWSEDQVLDENCWSDMEYCRKTKNWYGLSKTKAEFEALEFARKNGLDLVTVCPTLILGPTLQPTVNASTLVFLKILKEGYETLENRSRIMVDVRDVAQAVLLVYEKPEAEGRYICNSYRMKVKDLVEELRSLYPNYNYPKNYVRVELDEQRNTSSEKLQKLGWTFRPLKEMLVDSVENYREAGLLD